MITLARIDITTACPGYMLRWYYNGWHYWLFRNGTMNYRTVGKPYNTQGTRTVRLSSGMVTQQQIEAVRSVLNAREVYLYTDGGWAEVRTDGGSCVVERNAVNAYNMEFTLIIGSRKISATGYSPAFVVPVAPAPTYCETIIGTQIWMCQNWDAAYPGSKVYNNDEANRALYGGLYTWLQVNSAGFVPDGWRVPTLADWQALLDYVGGDAVAGKALKATGTTYWTTANGDDSFSFDARGGGIYSAFSGGFAQLKNWGNFWAADSFVTGGVIQGYYCRMRDLEDLAYMTLQNVNTYQSLRLIKNEVAPAGGWTVATIDAGLGDGTCMAVAAFGSSVWAGGWEYTGAAAFMLYSSDAGLNFNLQTLPAGREVCYGLSAASALNAWACGIYSGNDFLLDTTDAGTNWNDETPAVPVEQLLGIQFISATVGWSCGRDASANIFIQYTTNGGATWTQGTLAATAGIAYSVFFLNANEGWCVGADDALGEIVMGSTDGGQTWTVLTAGFLTGLGVLTDVHFFDSLIGWATGGDGLNSWILRTDDGGATWAQQTMPAGCDNGLTNAVQFFSANVGYLCGWRNVSSPYAPMLLETSDGGTTWTEVTLPAVGSSFLRGMHWDDVNNGYLVGNTEAGPILILTLHA